MLTTIGFDADDTLWQNESFFRLTQDRFTDLLSDHAETNHLHDRLLAAERRNLGHYGFGIKGFTLSMIETAIEVTEGRVPARVIAELVAAGREMLEHPIELLPEARATVTELAPDYRVILITKGDLFHQESKLAASGLGSHFSGVEIVSEKTPEIYVKAFARHGGSVETGMMTGNSVKSDILPMLAAGGYAALVPYPLVWEHERAEKPVGNPKYREVETLGQLPGWLDEIS